MRVVWKDSKPKGYKPMKYRNHMVYGSPKGWTTNIPGDDNIYRNHFCAKNAIDKHLGGYGQMGYAERIAKYGIQIVGKKGGDNSCA